MESLTELLNAGVDLLPKQSAAAVAALVSPDVADGVKMEFLKALRAKGETAGELAAFANELLARAVQPGVDFATLPGPTVDVCGTGGDRQGFFNVSTAVMFVAAAGGACVMKHGNRSVTSKSGAADVLEELGVRIELTPAELRETLERHGVAFIFAPAYHPAFKAIGPVRKALAAQGVPTIFNMLGPLLNPARPEHQLAGIFSAELLPKFADALHSLGRKRAWAVHGDGTDELALTGESQVRVIEPGRVESLTVTPGDGGLARCEPAALLGGDRVANARILTAILDGSDRGPKRDMVLLNSGAALVICGLAADLRAGVARAAEAIDSGAALAKLNALRGR
jgi:anthranilate phosphoribosyltransferase